MGELEHIKEAVGRVMEKTKQTMFIDELHELLYNFGADIRVIEDCV